MSVKKAIRMKLYPGMQAEYTKRHNELWPEMREMLETHGVQSYSIFLDPETNYLYGYLEVTDEALFAQTSDTAINRKWWDFMAPVMETNPDHSPVTVDLIKVFDL
jgi:L-rhamnose mutarotase